MVTFLGRVVAAILLFVVVAGCTPDSGQSQRPRVTIENESSASVEVFGVSHRDGKLTLITTLQPGDLFGAEPAGAECDGDISYVIQVAGREVATLDRPGCVGGTLVVTEEMIRGA